MAGRAKKSSIDGCVVVVVVVVMVAVVVSLLLEADSYVPLNTFAGLVEGEEEVEEYLVCWT